MSKQKLLTELRSHIGYYKRPGSITKFGEWYAKQVKNSVYSTAQWCAIFVSYCAAQAGLLGVIPLHAYTPSGVAWWKSQGRWTNGLAGVQPGDLVYFNFGSLGRVSHVGVVEQVLADGSVYTIEGNTSSTVSGDQRNSGTVARKHRKAHIVGYGRPNYPTPVPAVNKPKPAVNIGKLADEVIAGKHGNGAERKRRLGANYAAVQAEVNRRLVRK